MTTKAIRDIQIPADVVPQCPVFGECGGCDYQHLSYDRELEIKEAFLRDQFKAELAIEGDCIRPIVRSPKQYAYRNRLDLTMRRRRDVGHVLGFQKSNTKWLLPVEECSIAQEAISEFIPELRNQAAQKFTEKYRTANIVVKASEDGRVRWGGIGRRSLELAPEDYLWTEISGKRIYYSLDTFFQANNSILPDLMQTIESLVTFDKETVFLDLYAGVGLFGVFFADQVARTVLIEEVPASCKVMGHNLREHSLKNAEFVHARVEDVIDETLRSAKEKRKVAMIDPPRRGLSSDVLKSMTQAKHLDKLLYLSCHPESLIRDLKGFTEEGWGIETVVPFDFFPQNKTP